MPMAQKAIVPQFTWELRVVKSKYVSASVIVVVQYSMLAFTVKVHILF